MHAMTLPAVASITAGVLIIIQLGLMLVAAQNRRRARQSLGDGSDAALLRAVRRHGNFAENAAIFLVALALVEMLGAQRWLVAAAAVVFVVGRAAHAIGLSQANTVNGWRIAGIFATVAAGLTVGVRLIQLGLAHLPPGT
jgi:uncharacterized membrane protein YecN with MAPEG domain